MYWRHEFVVFPFSIPIPLPEALEYRLEVVGQKDGRNIYNVDGAAALLLRLGSNYLGKQQVVHSISRERLSSQG